MKISWNARSIAGLSMALCACPSPALAGEAIAHIEGWSVIRNESDCAIGSTFTNDSMLILKFDYRLDNVIVIFTDPSVKPLKGGEKKDLNTFFSSINGKLDDGWGSSSYTVSVLDSGKTAFMSKFDGNDFLNDFSGNSTLAFFYGDVLVQSFDLKGSAPAVLALRNCAHEQSRTNPSDPFAHSAG